LSNPEKNKPIAILATTKGKEAINYVMTYISKNLREKVKQVALDM